ncbi:hypothetical protein BD410DRAFT_128416 [Rickenella mellea]|uniref:Uncharacterized protein n=1 Tax=Rickenella mellea TaxID=50990 RepID=A0A4Y7Q8E1_9AGAM|nr:hypothetical protein BD410DRAFT_128416 [Rickenella mellea]
MKYVDKRNNSLSAVDFAFLSGVRYGKDHRSTKKKETGVWQWEILACVKGEVQQIYGVHGQTRHMRCSNPSPTETLRDLRHLNGAYSVSAILWKVVQKDRTTFERTTSSYMTIREPFRTRSSCK